MGQFAMPKGPMNQANWDKTLKAVKNAVEKADYDSGWIALPSDGVITHNLSVLPAFVVVYEANASDGEGFSPGTFTSVTRTTITVSSSKPYVRVWLDK
jgi:hypothetical protein